MRARDVSPESSRSALCTALGVRRMACGGASVLYGRMVRGARIGVEAAWRHYQLRFGSSVLPCRADLNGRVSLLVTVDKLPRGRHLLNPAKFLIVRAIRRLNLAEDEPTVSSSIIAGYGCAQALRVRPANYPRLQLQKIGGAQQILLLSQTPSQRQLMAELRRIRSNAV